MLAVLLISIAVFVGIFYLANHLYPHFEKQGVLWHKKRLDRIAPKLDRMFLDISPAKLIALDILAPLVCFGLAYLVSGNIRIALIVGAVGLAIPVFVVRLIEKFRRKQFGRQLPDAVMILCSSLKVGMSLQQSFEVLTEEMSHPISQEFGLVLRQLHMGFPLESALSDLRKRMKLNDLDLVVSALLIARETGGDITDTLAKVVATIQEREKLLGKLKALTAQAKLQALIMCLLPFVFAAVVYQSDKQYFSVFFVDPFGRILLVAAAILMSIGIFFIFKLSKVDI